MHCSGIKLNNMATFTSTKEIDNFQLGDDTIELTGYVDGVEGLRHVSNNTKVIFKFILNNNQGRKMKILMWGETAKTYESRIRNSEIIRIQRGTWGPANMTYFRKEDNLIPFELSVNKNSKITFMGSHQKKQQIINVQPTTIKKCANVEGELKIQGFIKVPFDKNVAKNYTYASGSITDGRYKIRIQINDYSLPINFPEGTHVEALGEIKRVKFDSVYLQVESSEEVRKIDEEIMTEDELRQGKLPPTKRSQDKENESPPKKLKFDSLNDSGVMSDSLDDSGVMSKLHIDTYLDTDEEI